MLKKISVARNFWDYKCQKIHQWAFIFPLILQNLPILFNVTQPHIIRMTGCFMVCVMQLGCNCSPVPLLTYFMVSLPNGETLISSEQITVPHCSAVQLTSVLNQFNNFNHRWRDRDRFFCRILTFKPNLWSMHQTVPNWNLPCVNFS